MAYNKMFYWSDDDAAYILDKLNAIDTWMLQKLVYYCQAWCLGIYKTEFINDTFKDYANGPLNKRLFDTHRGKRIVKKNDYPLTHIFSQSEIRHMENVIETYGNEDGDTLRRYTHNEKPWRVTRGVLNDGESDNKDIANELMMEYYRN